MNTKQPFNLELIFFERTGFVSAVFNLFFRIGENVAKEETLHHKRA
jgi:hypothetical protein